MEIQVNERWLIFAEARRQRERDESWEIEQQDLAELLQISRTDAIEAN
jgi:hypothetical protein